MASGSGSASAGDGASPLSRFFVHTCITFVHTHSHNLVPG
jgi:hypothetical protein